MENDRAIQKHLNPNLIRWWLAVHLTQKQKRKIKEAANEHQIEQLKETTVEV